MSDQRTIPCPECGGTGKIATNVDNLPTPLATPLEIECPLCGGTGEIPDDADGAE